MEYATSIIAGMSSLLGAVVGGFVAHFSSMRSHDARVLQEKQTRRVAQLERLNASLETISEQVNALVLQATSNIALDAALDPQAISKAELVTVELLIQVYLPSTIENFSQFKSWYANALEHVVKALVENANHDKKKASNALANAIKAQCELLESIQRIRKDLVNAVSAVEMV